MPQVMLNRPLVLEEPGQIPDGAGGFATDWTAIGTLWADVRSRTGRDRGGEAVSLSTTAFRIIIRASPYGTPSRPRPGQRFRDGVRLFGIEAVAEFDASGRYLTCFAHEEVAL